MEQLQSILIFAIPLLFAVTVHEVAHGFMALQFGDRTAKILGRLTLNPLKHIDPVGTILVPLILYIFGGFVFGWAKPVPINPNNFSRPRIGKAVVAAAGPLSNLLMAFIWGFLMLAGIHWQQSNLGLALAYMGRAGILINVTLLVLNLLPIPPLDGSRIISSILPRKASFYYDKSEPYGFLILIILLATGALAIVLMAPITYISNFIMNFYM